MTGVDATAIKPAIAATCKLTIMAGLPSVTQRNEQKSVIFIFVVFVLLLLCPSYLRRRATCVRHRLERWGSAIRHPWSVSAIERCSVAAHASRIGYSHAAGIHP